MDHRTTLSERAELAARRAQEADPGLSQLTPDRPEWRLRARHLRLVAAALGVDPSSVVITEDPARSTGPYPAYLITVHGDTTVPDPDGTGVFIQPGPPLYRFIPEPGIDGSYLLLQACPDCRSQVPGPAIASLVDLGRILTGDTALTTSYGRWDGGHAPGCSRLRLHPDD